MRIRQRYFFVYMMSNVKRNVLYTGITGNLVKRVYEHKEGLYGGFTSDYKIKDLVYYEVYDDPNIAIEREKQLKKWSRKKKNALIARINPTLLSMSKDLSDLNLDYIDPSTLPT